MKKTFLFLLLFLSLSAEAQIKKFEDRYPDGKICATGFKDKKTAYMTKRDLKSLVLPLFTIVLGKNFSMTKNLLSLRLSSHH